MLKKGIYMIMGRTYLRFLKRFTPRICAFAP